MNKAFLFLLGALMMLFVACETGLPRFAPAEGSYTEGGGSNRYSFAGGGTATYTVPDGGFLVDVTEDAVEEDEGQ